MRDAAAAAAPADACDAPPTRALRDNGNLPHSLKGDICRRDSPRRKMGPANNNNGPRIYDGDNGGSERAWAGADRPASYFKVILPESRSELN